MFIEDYNASLFLNAFLKRIGRLYPFVSGCGTLANTSIFRAADRLHGRDDWADVIGGPAWVPPFDYVGRSMKYVGDLDRKVSWVIDRSLKPGDTAFDIGANLGLMTLRMAARVGRNGRIHAFEPQARMRSYLCRSIERNGLSQVHLHPYGLGSESGTLTLNIPPDNSGAASISRFFGSDCKREDIELRTLDDITASLAPPSVALMKIDVEGFEAEVLRGGETFLRNQQPQVVILEEHRSLDSGLPEALEIMRDNGYDLFALPKTLTRVTLRKVSGTRNVKCHDFVAVARRAPQELRRKLRLMT